jgi:flagellar biosynthesis/type III secretory pathway ATPase
LAPFAVGCVLVGAALFISTGLRDESLGSVIAGFGFALYGLSTYLDPVVFETPLLEALRRAPVKAPLEQGLDVIAALLVASGLLLRWSAF